MQEEIHRHNINNQRKILILQIQSEKFPYLRKDNYSIFQPTPAEKIHCIN